IRLVWSPPGRSLVVLGYPDIYKAGDHVPEILKFKPVACEAIDALLVENMKIKGLHPRDLKLLPNGRGWLLVEFGGEDRQDADNLRSSDRRRYGELPRIYGRRDIPRRQIRRIVVGRARRRSIEGGVSAENVRAGNLRGLPRI